MCMDCFSFHDPTHKLSIIGYDLAAFPPPEIPPAPVIEAPIVAPEAKVPEVGDDPDGSDGKASESEEDTTYTIEEIVRGRTYRRQQQYLVRYVGIPAAEWLSYDELTAVHAEPQGGQFGKWVHAAPYDKLPYMLAALAEVPTPEYAPSSTKKKRRRSRRTTLSVNVAVPAPPRAPPPPPEPCRAEGQNAHEEAASGPNVESEQPRGSNQEL